MRIYTFVLCIIALLTTSSASLQADCACMCGSNVSENCCHDACGRWFLLSQEPQGLNFHGWINGGFIGNTASPASKFNGPYNAVDRSNESIMNQLYFVAERGLPQSSWGIGGRVDMLYGEDFFLAESIGIEKRQDGSAHWNREYYGVAFPQAFLTLGSDVFSVQVGHFYSVVGYEGVMAPDNFFYSKSYSYQFAGPFTHWGVQTNWSPNSSLTFQLGLHSGWDAFDRVSDDVGVVGKIRYDSMENGWWTSYALTTGKEFNNSADLGITEDFTNRTRYSWLVGLPLTDRLEYVFHHWLGFQADGALGGERADWYGIDQYLYYAINNYLKAGLRFEWFRDEEGTRVGLNRASNPNVPPFVGNFYSVSLGVNWTPTYNLIIRPEFRADWYDGTAVRLPFDDGDDDSQFMLGFDGILLF